tara:strand:+ start:84 stop:377 length:294 start_codon:yes stop_codon:yes gene_type:complete
MSVKLPPQGGTGRQVAVAVNQALDGILDSVRTQAITASQSSQVFSDDRVTADSVILLSPNSQATAGSRISAQSAGSFTVTFGQTTGAGETLRYVVLG